MSNKRLERLVDLQKEKEDYLSKLNNEKEKNKSDAKIMKEIDIEESAKKIELEEIKNNIKKINENNEKIENNMKKIEELENKKEKVNKAKEDLLTEKENYRKEEPRDKTGYIYTEWERDKQKIEDEIENIEKHLKRIDKNIKRRNNLIKEKQNETEEIFLKYHIRDEKENVEENISKESENQEDKVVEEQVIQEENKSEEETTLNDSENDEGKDDWEVVGNNLSDNEVYEAEIKQESEVEEDVIKEENKPINEKIKDFRDEMKKIAEEIQKLEQKKKDSKSDAEKAMFNMQIDDLTEEYEKKSEEIAKLLKNPSKIEKNEDSSKQKESEKAVYATNSKQRDKKIQQVGAIPEEIKVVDRVIKVPHVDINNKSELAKVDEFKAYLDDNGKINYDMKLMNGNEIFLRNDINKNDYKKRLKQIAKEYKVKIWDRKYLKNIDPYLIDSLEQIGEKDLANSLIQEAISLKEKEQADVILKGTYDMAKMNYVKRADRNVIRKIARGSKKMGMDVENYKENGLHALWKKIKSGFVKTFGKPEEQKYFPKSYSYKVHTEKREKTPLQKSADGYNLVKFSDFKDRINAPDEVKKAISHRIQEIKKSDKSKTKDNEKESVK